MTKQYKLLFNTLIVLLLVVCITGENAFSENIQLSTNLLDFFFEYLVLLLLILNFRRLKVVYLDKGTRRLLKFYFIWVLFTCFRGLFMAVDYFSYRNLFLSIPTYCFPLFFYIFTDSNCLSYFLSKWVKFCLPLFCVLAFVLGTDAYGFYLMPITLLSLFLFSMKPKWGILIFLVSVFVIIADLGARSNVLKFVVPLLLSLGYLFRRLISTRLLKIFGFIFILLPYILIPLAAFGGFNILQDAGYSKSYSSTHRGESADEDLFQDTRSFIYYEVIESAIENNYVLWGRTPARGNDTRTALFQEFGDEHNRPVQERFANEIGAANAFTHFGLVGLIIFLLMYYRSAYLALFRSNSFYMKLIGVSICFRSFFFFLEDYYSFRIQTFALIFLIGMALSERFRAMTNKDFKVWINSILR